jgi:hypothetical protein
MAALDRILAHVAGSDGAWVAPRAGIARHVLAASPDAEPLGCGMQADG